MLYYHLSLSGRARSHRLYYPINPRTKSDHAPVPPCGPNDSRAWPHRYLEASPARPIRGFGALGVGFSDVRRALAESQAGKKPLVRSPEAGRQALSEQNTEQTIRVRQVTDVHSNWSYQGDLQNGKFSYQLILDNGPRKS